MQRVISSGVEADSGVFTTEISPTIVGCGDRVFAIQIALEDRNARGRSGEKNHRMATAMSTTKLNKITGAPLSQQRFQLRVIGNRGNCAYLASIRGRINQIIIRPTFGGSNRISKEILCNCSGKTLALFRCIRTSIGGALLIDSIFEVAIDHFI